MAASRINGGIGHASFLFVVFLFVSCPLLPYALPSGWGVGFI
jgi:hypothetical protein